MLRRFTSYLLLSSFTLNALLPVYAMEDVQSIQKHVPQLKNGALPAIINFPAKAGATAAGCLFYAKRAGNIEILLGLRDDEPTYCNMGGKSDDEDSTLAQTAARESTEESLNIYGPHQDYLLTQPFVDLYTAAPQAEGETESKDNLKIILNRMYFVEQKHVDENVFNDRLKRSAELNLPNHSREYTQFKWVPVKDIYRAVKDNKRQFTISSSGEEITLFEPLFKTLQTETAQSLLSYLAKMKKKIPVSKNYYLTKMKKKILVIKNFYRAKKKKKIPIIKNYYRAKKKKIPIIKNYLHIDGAPKINTNARITWKTPKNETSSSSNPLVIDFDRDAHGHKSGIRVIFDKTHGTIVENEIVFDATKNRAIFGKAVAAKAAANLELRRLFQQEDADNYTQNPTLSELLLHLQLGSEYVPASNPGNQSARRQAFISNLKKYHERYGNTEGELKRDSDPLESDYERIADIHELETKFEGWIPLHHASTIQPKFLWLTGTRLGEFLRIDIAAKNTIPGMRATDIYFRGHGSIKESLDKTGSEDYENRNMDRRLCANMAITPGLKTTYTSSSSFEYFVNAHSVAAPQALKRFEEATQLLGMLDVTYLPYQSLFEQFYGAASKDASNSSWTVVFIKPDEIDTYSYPAHGGGSIFEVDAPTRQSKSADIIPSTRDLYQRAYRELDEKLKKLSEPSSTPTSTLNNYRKLAETIAEIRLLLHPSLLWDQDKTRVISIDRFPLSKEEQKRLNAHLTSLMIYDIGNWLSHHTQLTPGSFIAEPVIKKLYSLAHEGVTGKTYEEKVSEDALPHLIRNGHAEGVQQYFEAFPESFQKLKHTPKELALLAFNSGSLETLNFVCDNVLKTSIFDLLSKEDVIAIVRKALNNENISQTQKYLLKAFDFSLIDEKIRRAWALGAFETKNPDLLITFHQHVVPITEEIFDEVLESNFKIDGSNLRSLRTLVEFNLIPKELLAEKVLKFLTPQTSNNHRASIGYLLLLLIEKGLSYSENLPNVGSPLLFYLPYVFSHSDNQEIEAKIISRLTNDPNLFQYKNREGLTLLQFIQLNFLKGHSRRYSQISETLRKAKESAGLLESYPLFTEELGEYDVLSAYESPFADEEFLEWRDKFKAATSRNSLKAVMDVFREAPKSSYVTQYFNLKNPHDYYWQKQSKKVISTPSDQINWEKAADLRSHLETLIQEDKYQEIFALIDEVVQTPEENYISLTLAAIPNMWSLSSTQTSEYMDDKALASVEAFSEAVEAGKVVKRNFLKSIYMFTDTDESANIFKVALTRFFPNPVEIDTVQLSSGNTLLAELIFQAKYKCVKVLLEHRGCDLLKVLKNDDFSGFLHFAPKELIDFVEANNPEVFGYQDDQRDFLSISVNSRKFHTLEFYKRNLEALKVTFDKVDGLPLIFKVFDPDNLSLVINLLEEDPSILKLQSSDGLDIRTLAVHLVPDDSHVLEKINWLYEKYLPKT